MTKQQHPVFLTPPPKTTGYQVIIGRDTLPDVHGADRIPHIHIADPNGDEAIFQVLPGDTPEGMYQHALAYLALALTLAETRAWNQPYFHPPGMAAEVMAQFLADPARGGDDD